jgi:flavorubredoxin
MKEYTKAIKVTDNVYWVGAIDWAIRDFHGYTTDRGTSYNAFLIIDEKITLIDTVKAPFKEEMFARIESITPLDSIDYIVSNHAEPDHSGALPDTIAATNPEKVFASAMGSKALKEHFGKDFETIPVKTGDSISIGKNNLTFIETKLLHWPDSMVTYMDGAKTLFTQDGFGMHLAGSHLFADEYPREILEWEAQKYYANILMPYSPKVIGLLDSLPGLNLDIEYMLPDHGPMWRGDDINWILDLYRKWAEQHPTKKALVVYDTMWQSTEKMALAVASSLIELGLDVEVVHLGARDRSTVATLVLGAGALIVGSPTINNNIFPRVADTMTYLRGLRPHNLIGASFGSYGWSGEAVKQLNEYLTATGVELLDDGIRVKFVPDSNDLNKCYNLGLKIGKALLEKVNG